MLFNSFHFILFFLIVAPVYFFLPHKARWAWLLAASCYFYMCFVPVYIVILFATIFVDYFAALWIEDSKSKNNKKFYLVVSILSTCLILFIFKYFNFFNSNFAHLAAFLKWNYPIESLSLILPIGLSFHTFQSLSYVIEVYRGNQKAERHFGIYSLYVMFFPQLVAGPIERPQNLLHQFHDKKTFDYDRLSSGSKLILWGFFKKLVVADRVAIYVNSVYNNCSHHNGTTLLVATLFFAVQIYCDFSGYSDIAIGTARILGIDLMENFRRPYFSQNIREFWGRWHISLSTWFRDYVYIPLGGSRVSTERLCGNLMIVFLISGLWHGANWTFVIWGALHGTYMVAGVLTENQREKLRAYLPQNKLVQKLYTLWRSLSVLILVSLAWIFFRATSLHDALLITKKILLTHGPLFKGSMPIFIYSVLAVVCLLIFELRQEFPSKRFKVLGSTNWLVRDIGYVAMALLVVLFGVFDGGQFIYFQF